jgi:glycine reductase
VNLTLAYHPVRTLRFGASTRLDGTTLDIDSDELRGLLLEDEALSDVTFELVAPGEDCRAGPVFDIIEPRAKASGSSPDFPGILGPPLTAGMGTTHVLSGMTVTVLDEHAAGGSRGSIGRVLEMTGPAAQGSSYSGLHHLVVIPRMAPDKDGPAAQRAKRVAGLKTAVYLAQAAASQPPSESRPLGPVNPGPPGRPDLPRVAYVGQIFSRQRQAELNEPVLYGLNTAGMLPVLLHPDEWLDGAVVTSYYTSMGGAETYLYQNHPIITELYRRHHAGELNFVGTVASIAGSDNADRDRNCRTAASLVQWALNADAAVLTKYGGGVPHADLAETARLLETQGIRTSVMVSDVSRDRRVESALLFNFPEVNAIVYGGGNDTRWQVPPAGRVIAATPAIGELLAGVRELGAMNVAGVTNQQGASRLRAVVY